MARKSEDFEVGQRVKCTDPEKFLSDVRDKLTNREGVVRSINPSARPSPSYCQHLNVVFVLWQKRNGRGKEFERMMRPEDIEVIKD